MKPIKITENFDNSINSPVVIGVCAPGDPRIDSASRERCRNIVENLAGILAEKLETSLNIDLKVVYSTTLVDGERQADLVAKQFKSQGVNIIVCAPDTWAFPQLTLMSLMAHFPKNTPLNITCGNSASRPGVVYAQALNGAFAQSGRLTHLNVGRWPDNGENPQPSQETIDSLVDWCYAAIAAVGLRGRRIVLFGHDSMGMETALAHVLPTRNVYGIEITRLDMKLLSDILTKGAYDKEEVKKLRAFVDKHIGIRLELPNSESSEAFDKSLAMYIIIRDLLTELNAVGGGFMNQLEWGSDKRGITLPACDLAESLFNSDFDHNGKKAVMPFATEADCQALLTQVFSSWLTGGNAPLFMDFRKVWDAKDLVNAADELKVQYTGDEIWATKGIVDGNNSGSASLNWAAKQGATVEEIMSKVSMPFADKDYFPGGGNSVTFVSPGGLKGIASRLAYSEVSGMFSMIWDEAETADMPEKLAEFVRSSSDYNWPHTWVVPKYATMNEYKQFAPANHLHMIMDLKPARLQYWMDLTNTLSVNEWTNRPKYIEAVDRPTPLLYLLNGGEDSTKKLLK